MNFKKLRVIGVKGEDFVQGAYLGPKVERWGISFKPVITKGDDGWSTHIAEGWASTIEIEGGLQSQRERLIDFAFIVKREDFSQDLFDTLGEAKRWFSLWNDGKVASNLDIVFHQLGEPLGAEFLSIQWNDVYGTAINRLQGELKNQFPEGDRSGEEFSDAAYRRYMEIVELIDYKMSPELEERFQTGVRATEESKALEDAMNFGDIEVGFKQDSGEGCAIMLVVAAVLFALFLLRC